MRKSRFSEEQIIGILKEHQAGIGAKELCRKHGISDGTFYKWRSKYGGMEVSEAKRLKALEVENAKLKKMLAEHMLDVATLKEMLGKTFEARCKAESCGLGHDREKLQPAAGLRPGRDRSARLSARINQTCGHRAAREAEGAFQRTTALRLSAATPPAGPRGLAGELEEALPDLPRRRLNSP